MHKKNILRKRFTILGRKRREVFHGMQNVIIDTDIGDDIDDAYALAYALAEPG